MSTPQDPPEEPERDETPTGPADDESVWRSIIDNYGARADIEEPEVLVPPSPRALYGEPAHGDDDPGDHYVPPPPPPIPRPEPPRLLAWLGLFGVPAFVLVCLVAGLHFPSWLGLILMVWFVGGFVYLVASMQPQERDGYDDGAVL